MESTQRKSLLFCGVLGPLVFAITTVGVAATRSNYNHASQFISELGETGAAFGWAMNYFGFMLSAALILIFVLASRVLIARGVLNVFGSLCLATFAICLFLAGVYSCDLGCSPDNPTPEQQLHDLVSIIAFPAFILGTMAWGVLFLRDAGWRRFGAYSLTSGIASIVILIAMIQSEPTREGTGIYQRLFLFVLFAWLAALSIRLQRATTHAAGPGQATEDGSPDPGR